MRPRRSLRGHSPQYDTEYFAGGFAPVQILDTSETFFWEASQALCFFPGTSLSWDGGASGPETYDDALEACGYNPEAGLPFPKPHLNENREVMACGSDTCAHVDCSEYDDAVSSVISNTNSSQKKIYASIPLAKAQVLQSSPVTMYCSNGRYAWSTTVSLRRFEALGAGDIYYKLGFRNGDRLVSMWKFNPTNHSQIGAAYAVSTPIELADAYAALVPTTGGATYIAIKIRRGTSDWTVFVSAN